MNNIYKRAGKFRATYEYIVGEESFEIIKKLLSHFVIVDVTQDIMRSCFEYTAINSMFDEVSSTEEIPMYSLNVAPDGSLLSVVKIDCTCNCIYSVSTVNVIFDSDEIDYRKEQNDWDRYFYNLIEESD